jgi:hypothetical protein
MSGWINNKNFSHGTIPQLCYNQKLTVNDTMKGGDLLLQVQFHFGCCEELGVKGFLRNPGVHRFLLLYILKTMLLLLLFPLINRHSWNIVSQDQEFCTTGTMYKDISGHDVSSVNGPCVYG